MLKYKYMLVPENAIAPLKKIATEIIRIDPTPEFLNLRFPQIISIFIIIIALVLTIPKIRSKIT